MGLFARGRGGDVASSTGGVNDLPKSAEEHARHEAAALAVLRSLTAIPPKVPSSYDFPQRASQSPFPGEVSPNEMRALQMSDLPPHPALPVKGGNFGAVRGEDAFDTMLDSQFATKGKLVVVNFGASWCTKCADMLPVFGEASRTYGDTHFVLADVDTLPRTAEHVRFTPTFSFWRDGRKVDEVSKIKPKDFADRMWLHAEKDLVKV